MLLFTSSSGIEPLKFGKLFPPGLKGLILSSKIWVLRNFLTKIWEFWTHQFFQKFWEILRQNILVQLAGQISENFPQNILIGTQFENLRKFSEFWEFCQNSENIFVDRTKPWNRAISVNHWKKFCQQVNQSIVISIYRVLLYSK